MTRFFTTGIALAFLAWAGLAMAAEVAEPPATPRAVPLTSTDVEAWMDGFLPYALQRGEIAGAVVVVVKDGAVLFEKGYGTADVEARTPVDPKATLFRPGSVSKLFTWTAVMQQVEAGKIDLDADINTYLDYKIPARDGKPITMRHLMTHTPGFEERIKNLIVMYDKDKPIPTLGAALKEWVPERVFEAGTTPAYSNYGAALAGYVVERVSGERFEDYIESHIYKPLNMTRSSFHSPLEPDLLKQMSKGYPKSNDKPGGYEIVALSPAGNMAGTGDDMARFMIAHLQNGKFGDAQILKPETAQKMHSEALTLFPQLNRMVLGFYEQNLNGHRIIGHGGDTQFFHSNLMLFLDDNVGLFISMNSGGKDRATLTIRNKLLESFADRYFPAAPQSVSYLDAETAAAHAKLFQGAYGSSRNAFSSFLSVGGFLSTMSVIANPDGTISFAPVALDAGGELKHYKEIAPFVWQDVAGKEKLAAIVENGAVSRFSIDMISAIMVAQKIPFWKSPNGLLPALGIGFAAILLTFSLWPVIAIVRGRYGVPFKLAGPRARAYRYVRVACLIALIAMGEWAILFSIASGGLEGLSRISDNPAWILLVEAVTLVAFVGGLLVSLYNLLIVWRDGASWFARLWGIVLTLSFLVFTWTAWVYHLINFSTQF